MWSLAWPWMLLALPLPLLARAFLSPVTESQEDTGVESHDVHRIQVDGREFVVAGVEAFFPQPCAWDRARSRHGSARLRVPDQLRRRRRL